MNNLIGAIQDLRTKLNVPGAFAECGIKRDDFTTHLDEMAMNAFDDQCTGSNPRPPLVSELKEPLKRAYGG